LTLPPHLLAVLAAIFYASGSVSVKLGVQDTSVLAGLVASLASATAFFGAILFISPPDPPSLTGVAAFVLAGIFGPMAGRSAAVTGVDRMGASRSVPIQGSLYPISATLIAVVALGQGVEPWEIVGLAVVVAGVWVLSREQSAVEGRTRATPDAETVCASPRTIPPIVFPLLAGLFYGLSDVARARAVDEWAEPLAGAVIGTFTGLVLWGTVAVGVPRLRGSLRFGRGVRWFAASGIFSALAVTCTIEALRTGDVALVSPIIAAQPLPVLVLSALFLRRLERLDFVVVLGALAIVLGVLVISL
jgi:drug/metabolite transporter (DMT)-like permease